MLHVSRSQPDFKGFFRALRFPPSTKTNSYGFSNPYGLTTARIIIYVSMYVCIKQKKETK